MKREDIRLKPKEEKERVYLKVDTLFQLDVEVSVKEHKSGFPAVTVDCGDVHVLTDILSLEEWWAKKKELEEWWAKKKEIEERAIKPQKEVTNDLGRSHQGC